jgi:hypothetical protein
MTRQNKTCLTLMYDKSFLRFGRKPPNASASAAAGPARQPPTNDNLAGKVWLIIRAVGGRLHAVVGRPCYLTQIHLIL